jgi:hypothetical protein
MNHVYFLVLPHSLLHSQRSRMVNIFGTSDSAGKAGPSGPPGPAGSGGLKKLIQCFPHMILGQIRRELNDLTLLIETIPPKKDADVELTLQKTVNSWKMFNNKDCVFKPVDEGGVLKKVTLEMDPLTRYGLVFDKSKGIMYHMENREMLLTTHANVLLTMTFMVGIEDDVNDKEVEEEFIISDYRWNTYDRSPEKFRGVSIISKSNEKFDLYLHGVPGEDGTQRWKFGKDLDRKLYYTLQVYWNKVEKKAFASLYKDGKLLIEDTSFPWSELPDITTPAFYLGGFNASTTFKSKVMKSKCFTGIIINVGIVKLRSEIPKEIMKFIVESQTIMNDDWLTSINTTKEDAAADWSILKKKKKIT